MSKSYAEQILEKELEIVNTQNTIEQLLEDPNIIPIHRERYDQNDPRCPKTCGRFDGGNRSCRHHCDRSWYDAYDKYVEKRRLAMQKHITPLSRRIKIYKEEIEKLKEKQSLPYLRTDIMTTSQELQQLQKDDPLFRQKKTDLSKELFEQAQELDTLEKKYNLFGNIPSLKPEIITPDPVVQTTTELGAINTRPLIIGGIVGLVGLFLIWRLK
jgi:hypothetical protein